MENLSFAKNKHLRKSSEFKIVREANNKLFTKSILIYFLENNLGYPRLGLVVSKTVSKKSVTRNLVKRRLREVFRLNQNQIQAIDIVIIARLHSAECSYHQLEDNFMKALRYAKKTKEPLS